MRISQSFRIGPFRVGASVPVGGRGRARVWGGVREGRRGWLGVSTSAGKRRRRRP
jgi:hypothetical protein